MRGTGGRVARSRGEHPSNEPAIQRGGRTRDIITNQVGEAEVSMIPSKNGGSSD